MIVLTVALGSVLQTESECQGGIVLEKLRGEGVPPQAVAFLPDTSAYTSSAVLHLNVQPMGDVRLEEPKGWAHRYKLALFKGRTRSPCG